MHRKKNSSTQNYPRIFQETLAYLDSALPLGSANNPIAMRVNKKYYPFFEKLICKLGEEKNAGSISSFSKLSNTLRKMEFPDKFSLTEDEIPHLPAVIAMSLLAFLCGDYIEQLAFQDNLEHVQKHFEIYQLFGVGNCGTQCFGGILYLVEKYADIFPLCILETRKQRSVESKDGFADPENGHQTILVGNIESPDCRVFDLWQRKMFFFRDINKETLPGLRNNIDFDRSSTLMTITDSSKKPVFMKKHLPNHDQLAEEAALLIAKIKRFLLASPFVIKHYHEKNPQLLYKGLAQQQPKPSPPTQKLFSLP